MLIAVDLDGPVYEWSKTARYMLRTYRGYADDGPLGREATHWDYIKDNTRAVDWAWLWSEGVELGLFRYGHVTQGAIVGLRELQKRGHELVLVTHRPASAVNDTMAFVSYISDSRLEPIRWSGTHILTKQEPKILVDADVLIDDKHENTEDWVLAGRVALLFDRPWNKGVRTCSAWCLCRVSGAAHVYRARGWQGKNGVVRLVDGL